ncbi:integrin alpha, partial [Crocosphaera watsonii]|uniref:integrin alpha n=1 Tax=Crocosphaera watsonii TaxID=263511 RepID=UPI00065F849B
SSSIDLSSLDGSNGFVLNGIDEFDISGFSVSSAGDFNGDGFDDILIGARDADPNGNAGESYIVFGKAGGFDGSFDLSSLEGSNGFVLNGIDAFDRSGISVSSAGDVNGDGFDDILIGAFEADPNGNSSAGESYVVFGKVGGFSSSFDLSSLDGSNGFVLNGIDASDRSGISVSSAGDVNGDGFDDILIGAFTADPNGNSFAGESYVVFGKAGGFDGSFDLSSLDGSNGFALNGIERFDLSGRSVSSAGDVNGDGFDDILIGASTADPNGNREAGESYVVFGKAGGFSSIIDLSSLDGSNGFILNGIDRYDDSGYSVSSAGDVNGDGFDDVIIGARFADPAGESY